MNEGVFRVLNALGHGREVSRSETLRRSAEAHSVLTDLSKSKAKWFDIAGESFKLSNVGLAALAREAHARRPALSVEALVEKLRQLTRERPAVKREFDQVHATLESVAKRARILVERGDVQRGLLFFGDDDLAALAVGLLLDENGDDKKLTVLDLDDEILAFYEDHPRIQTVKHDLRDPLPSKLRNRFGTVFTDPPYASAGFGLFAARAVQALKADGRLYMQLGFSRRARERGLAKQRLLLEMGFLVEAAEPDAAHYDGAESIGSVSTLLTLAMTPQTKAPNEEALRVAGEAGLYTRTS